MSTQKDSRPNHRYRKMTSAQARDRVQPLLERGLTITEIAHELGKAKSTICWHARRLGFSVDERYGRRYDWTQIQAHYDAGRSMRECLARFGCSKSAWQAAVNTGKLRSRPRAVPLDELLVTGRKTNRYHLKSRLLTAGVKVARCEECGIDRWRDKPLSLALHHINGDGLDNRLENLAILCPNCHSQTDNFGVRNRRKPSGANRELAA